MPRAANRPHRQITKPQTGADSAEQIVAFEPIAQIYLPPAYRCGRNGGSDIPLINRSGATAQPARALNRSAVGLGASFVPPSDTGMSVRQENEPCSITALLPSARAITVGFPLALSGSACQRRTVSSMRSRFICSPTFLNRCRTAPAGLMPGTASPMFETSILCAILSKHRIE
jgi:hypothetical protein